MLQRPSWKSPKNCIYPLYKTQIFLRTCDPEGRLSVAFACQNLRVQRSSSFPQLLITGALYKPQWSTTVSLCCCTCPLPVHMLLQLLTPYWYYHIKTPTNRRLCSYLAITTPQSHIILLFPKRLLKGHTGKLWTLTQTNNKPHKKYAKDTARSIPVWSPTTVLTAPSPA